MRKKYMLILVGIVVGVLLSSVVFVLAGNPDSPSASGATNSFTLDDIYNRLDTGADGAQSTFTEPGVAPGTGTMHTLNEIYDLIGLRAPVPKTGAGDLTGYTLVAGEDGHTDMRKGVVWPVPRFTDNGNDTVTDNLTGLIWLKNADCIRTQYPGFDTDGTSGDGQVTWHHALDFVAGINAGTYPNCGAGHTDWRLPNVREMQSLVHYGFADPAVPDTAGTAQLPGPGPDYGNGDPFDNVQSDFYWSSTTRASDSSSAWGVLLGDGYVVDVNKASLDYVWPVRGGQ